MSLRAFSPPLFITGFASAGTKVSVTNDDSGEILSDGMRTRGRVGFWKDVNNNIFPAPATVTVQSSDGCSVLLEKGASFGRVKIDYQEVNDQTVDNTPNGNGNGNGNGNHNGNGNGDDDDEDEDD